MINCNVCKSANGDNANFCRKCGESLENIESTGEYYVVGKDYTRLGGWFKFFLVLDIVMVIASVYSFLRFLYATVEGVGFTELPIILAYVIPAFLLLISIIFRFMRDDYFLFWFQISTITRLLALIYLCVAASHAEAFKITAIVGIVIMAGVSFVFITLYYCKSRRVKAYMGSVEYKKKAILKF